MIPRSVQLACICLLALLGKSPTVCAGEFEMLVLMHDSGRVERYELKTGKHLGTLLSGLPPSNAVLFDTMAGCSFRPASRAKWELCSATISKDTSKR
jgi:hypothetical protein